MFHESGLRFPITSRLVFSPLKTEGPLRDLADHRERKRITVPSRNFVLPVTKFGVEFQTSTSSASTT